MERALERTPGSCGIGCNWTTMELNVHFCPVCKCTLHPICCEDFGITMLEGNDEYLCISCHVRSLSRSYVNGVLEEAYNDDDYNDNNFAEKIDQASDLNDDDDHPDLSPSVTVFIPQDEFTKHMIEGAKDQHKISLLDIEAKQLDIELKKVSAAKEQINLLNEYINNPETYGIDKDTVADLILNRKSLIAKATGIDTLNK